MDYNRTYEHLHIREIRPRAEGERTFIDGGEVGVYFMGEINVYEEPAAADIADFTRWAIEVNAKHFERERGICRPELEGAWTTQQWTGRDTRPWAMLILREVGT